jgi:N-acetylneuraminic acid mutarotase
MRYLQKTARTFKLLIISAMVLALSAAAAQADSYHLYDTNQDCIIGDFELLNAIDDWAVGNLGDFELLDLIDDWASGNYCNSVPSRPTGVTAVAGVGSITVNWSTVSGAASYNLYWNTTDGVTTSDNKVSNVTPPYLHAGLTNGIKYYYVVTAENSAGESVPSSEVSATPQLSPPNIVGTYITGPATVNSSNCGTLTFDTGSLIIDTQNGTSFSGTAVFRSTINNSQIEVIEELTGTVSVNGILNGTFIDTYYEDGVIISGGNGTFTGQINGGELSLHISGEDTYGDVCIYTMDVTFNLSAPLPWVTKAPIPQGRFGLSSSTANGKIYTIGGRTGLGINSVTSSAVEEYDPATDNWVVKASMPTARCGLSASTINGKIYTFGGVTGNGTSPDNITDVFEVYDPATDTWTVKNSMPNHTAYAASCVVNGKIYIVGGWWYPGTKVLVYDPVTDSWETKSPMPTGRDYLMCGALDDKIYAIGGRLRWSSNAVTIVEEYDPVTDVWVTKTSMITAHVFGSGGVVNGKFYAVGGIYKNLGNYTNNYVEEYDPVTDTWSGKSPMPTGRYYFTVSVVGNQLFAIGGYSVTITEAYTPGHDVQ